MANDFDFWEPTIHDTPEQVKRQKRATDVALTPLSISDGIGKFRGSSCDYYTSLIACQCTDFSRRKLPCKHIYRLAHELNVFQLPDITKSDSCISSHLRIKDAMAIIDTFPDATKQELFSLIRMCIVRDVCHVVQKTPEIDTLIQNNFFEFGTDYTVLLNGYRKNDLLDLLSENAKKDLPKKTTKADLIELINTKYHFILEELLGDKLLIHIHPSIKPLSHKIHRRLCNECIPVDDGSFWDGE